MKTTSGQKVKIGMFVIAGLIVIVLGIFFIGSQKSLFNSTFRIYGVFNNVSGLQVGNNVRFAGINVGVVQSIEIQNDTSVKVNLTLNSDVKKFIKSDAKVSIGSDGLMGDKLVVIGPGVSETQVDNGSKLGTTNPLDVDKLINKVTKIADNANTLIENLSDIVVKINKGKGSIGKLLNSDKMANDLEGTVRQAQSTIKNVHQTSATLNEDLTAAQHNFLLKGFFNKKKKREKQVQDSIKKAQKAQEKAQKKAEDQQ